MGFAPSQFQTCRFLRKSSILVTGYCAATIFDICRRVGWPGGGLLLLRLLTGAALIGSGIGGIREGPPPLTVALQIIGIAAATLLLVGVFTPVAGVLAAAAKVWSQSRDFPRIPGIHGLLSRRRSWRQRWR
jgi:hypothetical protein